MATGWITWMVLLAAAAPGPDDVVHWKDRSLRIPLTIPPGREREIREVILYISRDQGSSWGVYQRTTPDKKEIDFVTQQDGPVWFGIAEVDRDGKLTPPDIYKAKVGLKVVIDTAPPTVRITSAERVGDEVQVSWEAKEERPDWTTLKLEYKVGNGQWVPLPVVPSERGTARLRPGAGEVSLQLSMRDLAGNEGKAEKTLAGGGTSGGRDAAVVGVGGVAPPPGKTAPERIEEPERRSDAAAPPPLVGAAGGAASPQPVQAPPAAQATPAAPATRGALPPLQIVNKRQIKVGFEVGKVGVSGVASVDVYATEDEGQSWAKTSDGASVSLPVGDGRKAMRGTVTVALPKDGVRYGFYLVLKSRAGLAKPAPSPGTPPQVRVEVDTTLPDAMLFAPQPDSARRDCVVLTWRAEDRNLASNPISLEWSSSPSGPWTFVGDAQLPNALTEAVNTPAGQPQPTGRYTWQVPANVPAKVYLKLTVRDTAGNAAVAQTKEPVLIDLTEPEIGNVAIEPGR